jgi:UDP-glucose 4-epimerase
VTGATPQRLEDRTIAITGGAGFVGSALTRRLGPGNTVRILDAGLHERREPVSGAGVEMLKGDVRDRQAVDRLVEGCDVVIHLASIAGVGAVLDRPSQTMDTAILGARNVLAAAAEAGGVERVVMFSTSEVAGRFAYNVQEETTFTGAHSGELRWTYAAAKLASEFYAQAYYAEHSVPAVCLRPFNIYGPGQLGVGAVREFVRAVVDEQPLKVKGEGSAIRAWCYIDDVVDAAELSCLRDNAVGQVFNIGNPRSVITVRELARLVARLADSDVPIEYVPSDEVDVELRIPDISRARQLLGFEPKVDLDEGLLRTIEWYRTEHAA